MFQQSVAATMGMGIPGELAYDGPMRAKPWNLVSNPEANVIGATAYTIVSEGVAMAGGTGVFAGILVSPKEHAAHGTPGSYTTGGGPLAATMTLPDETIGTLLTMGAPYVILTTAANPGDLLVYDTTTGALSSVPAGTTAAGTGKAFVPNAKTILRASAANGLAIAELTN